MPKLGPKDPKDIMLLGMAFLAIAMLWPRFLPVTGNLGPDAIDGVHGVLMGVAIALNLRAAWLGGRQRRGDK
jgi:hypothetical protein